MKRNLRVGITRAYTLQELHRTRTLIKETCMVNAPVTAAFAEDIAGMVEKGLQAGNG